MEQRIQEWTKWNLWKTAFKNLLQKKYLQKNVFVFSEEKSFVIFLVSCTFYITQFCFKNFSSGVIFAYLHSNGLLTDFIFIWGTFKIQVLALEKRKDSSDYLN